MIARHADKLSDAEIIARVAAEGANEVCLRLDAARRARCGGADRILYCWYAETPLLLQKGAVETLIAMAK